MKIDISWKPLAEIVGERNRAEWGSWQEERRRLYQKLSDPVFLKYQRGESTKQDWLDAIEEVKRLTPKPEVLYRKDILGEAADE